MSAKGGGHFDVLHTPTVYMSINPSVFTSFHCFVMVEVNLIGFVKHADQLNVKSVTQDLNGFCDRDYIHELNMMEI